MVALAAIVVVIIVDEKRERVALKLIFACERVRVCIFSTFHKYIKIDLIQLYKPEIIEKGKKRICEILHGNQCETHELIVTK